MYKTEALFENFNENEESTQIQRIIYLKKSLVK